MAKRNPSELFDAVRHIGDAVIYLKLDTDGTYEGEVVVGRVHWLFSMLKISKADVQRFGPRSEEAFDRAAEGAVTFGAYYSTGNRERELLPGWAPEAAVADAIDEATSWASTRPGHFEVVRPKVGPRPNPGERRPITRHPDEGRESVEEAQARCQAAMEAFKKAQEDLKKTMKKVKGEW